MLKKSATLEKKIDMRYERDDLCRVKNRRLKDLIRKKYGAMMPFYAHGAEVCKVSQHTLHMFIGSGRPSQKKNAHAILHLLGLPSEAFPTYFTSNGSSPDDENFHAALEQLAIRIDDIAKHLNALDEKIDAIFQMVKAFAEEEKFE